MGEKISFEELGYNHEGSGEYKKLTDKVFDRICELGEGFEPKNKKESKKKNEYQNS